jgi:hypothetical protein
MIIFGILFPTPFANRKYYIQLTAQIELPSTLLAITSLSL